MHRKAILTLVFLLLFGSLQAQGPDMKLAPGVEQAAQAITEYRLRSHVNFLADDLLEGRAPGTRGSEIGMAYIKAQFQRMGLQPGGPDGQWYQRFDVVGITSDVPKTATFRRGDQSLTLKAWDDFIAFTGVQKPVAAVEDAELVFVGYGIVAPEYNWDDYKDVDVSGKILLMMNNDPAGPDPTFFAGKTRLYYGRWSYKYEMAASKGAAGAIIIHTTPSAGYPFSVVQSSWTGEQYELPAANGQDMPLKAWTTETATRQLVSFAGKNLDQMRANAEKQDFRPVPLGVTLSLRMTNQIKKVQTANVLGLLPGADPVLKNEVVVYSAHHDHLGIGHSAAGDSIYNGALDNASGVASMLSLAAAFSRLQPPPKRSVLFAAVAAEESGLLGSQYYATHPSFSPGRIAANINIDGVNIWGKTRDLIFIGFGKSNLDEIVVELAKLQGRIVKPDQFPDRGFFYRSDQFNFAKIGVPAVYLDTGVDFIGRPAGWGKEQIEKWEATQYHQPSDEYSPDWNLEGAIEDCKLEFWLGVRLANQPEMPQWNAGDEFEAARKKALAAERN